MRCGRSRRASASARTRPRRTSCDSWLVSLLAAAVETRFAGSGRAPGWTKNQALRLGVQFAQDFVQLLRGTQQVFAERVEAGYGLVVELVAQLPARLRERLDGC